MELGHGPAQKKTFLISVALFALFFLITAFFSGGILGETIHWTQQYSPVLNSSNVSALVAALPLIVMFTCLTGFRRSSVFSCSMGLIVALILSVAVWDMPIGLASNATLFGFMLAACPILWTLTCAVWVYNLLVESGEFEVIKKSLGYVSNDRRIQVLLLIFGFGTLLEGIAAFGAPIAVTSAMMVGIGFPPMTAAVLCLLSDTTPCAFGTQGTPLVVLQAVTGIDINHLSTMIGRQTPITTAIFASVLICFFAGWKGYKKIWWIPLAAGCAYGLTAFIVSNTVGPYVVDISGALAAIGVTILITKFWHPKKIWLLPTDDPNTPAKYEGERIPPLRILKAWSPYFLMIAFISAVNASSTIKTVGAKLSTVTIHWPNLHLMISKVPPATLKVEEYTAIWTSPLLTIGGTLVFFVGVITIFVTGVGVARAAKCFKSTLKQLTMAYATILCILGIAQLMNYSAMTYTMGMAFAQTGFWLPMSVAILGLLGVFLTGTDAASNALFGQMVCVATEQSGHSGLLAASTLSSGGVMGKSCAPQDLAIVTASVNLPGAEGEIIRRVVWVSVIFTVLIGTISMLQAHVFTWMVPVISETIHQVERATSPVVLWGIPIIVGLITLISVVKMVKQWTEEECFCPSGDGDKSMIDLKKSESSGSGQVM